MSSKIDFTWECPACLGVNPQTIIKPGFFQATVFQADCKACGSTFQIRALKGRGQFGTVSYQIVTGQLSIHGKKELEQRQQTPVRDVQELTKEEST